MIKGDFHTHTRYSDGKGKIAQNVQAAKEKGLSQIGISDHGLGHVAFGLRRPDLPKMRHEVDRLNGSSGIEVLLGVEANICSSYGELDFKAQDESYFDYVIAGFHQCSLNPNFADWWKYSLLGMVKRKNFSSAQISRFTRAFVNVIKSGKVDIISHLFYAIPVDTKTVAEAAADYGVIMELNGKKVSIPDEDLLILADNKNVKLMVNSDAHSPDRVGDFSTPFAVMERLGIDKSRLVNWDKPLTFNRKTK